MSTKKMTQSPRMKRVVSTPAMRTIRRSRFDLLLVLSFGLVAACDRAGSSSPRITLLQRTGPDAPWTETTRSLLGEEIAVRAAGLREGTATVRATAGAWSAAADFAVSESGTIDLASDAPIAGSYAGIDPDGLFWSMTSETPSVFPTDAVTFEVEMDGEVVATATLDRFRLVDGAQVIPVDAAGLVGTFFVPPGGGRRPALLTLGGAEGGIFIAEELARHYASLGYPTLALAYHGAPGLPDKLTRIPLEYFRTALDWLQGRPEVDPLRIAVMGISYSGPLAPLLAATYPDVGAAIAMLPSGVIWPGAVTLTFDESAWTLGGADVPHIEAPAESWTPEVTIDADGSSVTALRPAFESYFAAAEEASRAAATIRVENASGPILLLGASDDQVWPSCDLANIAMERLLASGHARAHGDGFECYDGAGHSLWLPGRPTTGQSKVFLGGGWFVMGGSPGADGRAARSLDRRIRSFLRDHL